MLKKSVAFHTLGCKVNRYETDAVTGSFIKSGYEIKNFGEKCDVYVINTCTVTNEAGRKSGQYIRRAKNKNPDAIIIAMGCHVELSDNRNFADILIGNKDKMDAVKLADDMLTKKRSGQEVNAAADNDHLLKSINDDDHIFEDMGYVTSQEETRAFIKIEDGCNNFCSYCAIPLARGRVRSRDEISILEEARLLAGQGFKEIVFTGIHVCSYSSLDNQSNTAVIDLAGKISKIKGIERIRLGSLEPNSISSEFIEKIAGIPQICPHFHVSLQSGSDNVLKRMNRKYTTTEYFKVIESIRSKISNAEFTTDIIAGFPGESDQEHQETLEFCRKINFLDMHVFKFSKRKGTKAEKMGNQIKSDVINKRSRELMESARIMRNEHFSMQQGKTVSVLIEKYENKNFYGYTDNYYPVRIDACDLSKSGKNIESDLKGEIKSVLITGYENDELRGEFS